MTACRWRCSIPNSALRASGPSPGGWGYPHGPGPLRTATRPTVCATPGSTMSSTTSSTSRQNAEGRDGGALALGQEEEGVVKAAARGGGLVLDVLRGVMAGTVAQSDGCGLSVAPVGLDVCSRVSPPAAQAPPLPQNAQPNWRASGGGTLLTSISRGRWGLGNGDAYLPLVCCVDRLNPQRKPVIQHSKYETALARILQGLN